MASQPITVTSTGNLSVAFKRITGYSFRETAGDVASIVIRDGGSGGTIVMDIALAANGADTQPLDPPVLMSRGTPHATVTGTISGTVYGIL